MLARTSELSKKFVDIERDFIREKLLPDFEYTCFETATEHKKLSKSLESARVALVSTAGLHLDSQEPFIINRAEGDDSFRSIPSDSAVDSFQLSHPGYNTARVIEDVNTVFPLERLHALAQAGIIGSVASNAYSFMGYIPRPARLIEKTAPAIAEEMTHDNVDLVLLVPA